MYLDWLVIVSMDLVMLFQLWYYNLPFDFALADENGSQDVVFKRNMEGAFLLNCTLPGNQVRW